MIIETSKGFVLRERATRSTSTFLTAALRLFQLRLYSRFRVFHRLCILAFKRFVGFAIGSFAGISCWVSLRPFLKQEHIWDIPSPARPAPTLADVWLGFVTLRYSVWLSLSSLV